MMDEEDPFQNTERHTREGDRFVAGWLMKVVEGWEFWPSIRCCELAPHIPEDSIDLHGPTWTLEVT
jgi:hypothetical protein